MWCFQALSLWLICYTAIVNEHTETECYLKYWRALSHSELNLEKSHATY